MALAHLPPFAWTLARRASVAMIVSAGLAAVIVVTTDEATSTAGMRFARLAALGPLVACLSVLSVCAHARVRGEIGALAALGMKPWEAARGAALAGWAFGLLALVPFALPWVDPGSLFPRFSPPIDWVMDASGASARSAAATVFADGAITAVRQGSARAAEVPERWAALACLAPIALSGPAWAVTPMSHGRRVASILAAGGLLIVVLHAIAAGRITALFAPVAAVPLLAASIVARRR
jgi:hypothetical protein